MVEEYPDLGDDYEDQLEDQAELQAEASKEAYDDASPTYKEKDDLYSLFWKVVQTSDSSKVGNLDPKTELGNLDMSVRDCQYIALLAITLGHPGFARFFMKKAETILSTSASKKGWLPELFVSQRKLTAKSKELPKQFDPSLVGQTQPRKKGIFGR